MSEFTFFFFFKSEIKRKLFLKTDLVHSHSQSKRFSCTIKLSFWVVSVERTFDQQIMVIFDIKFLLALSIDKRN